jgi:hypothetical protein
VAEEVHLAVGRDAARAQLADVVQQRGPAHLEPRHRLTHHLLRVLPHVFVAPLAVAEADHRLDLGQQGPERPAREQRVEAPLGLARHEHLVEAAAHVGGEALRGGLEVARVGARERGGQRERRALGLSDALGGPLEGLEGTLGARLGGVAVDGGRHGLGLHEALGMGGSRLWQSERAGDNEKRGWMPLDERP